MSRNFDSSTPVADAGRNSVRWVAMSNVIRTIFAAIQLLIIARFTSVEDFGVVILISSIIVSIQQISDAGLSSALIRFRDVSSNEKSSLYWMNAFIGAAATFAIILLSEMFGEIFSSKLLSSLIFLSSPILLIQSLFLQIRVLSEKNFQFKAISTVEISSYLVGFLFSCIIICFFNAAYALVAGQLVTVIVQLLLSWCFLARNWRPRIHFKFAEVRRFLSFGADMFLINLATSLTVQIDIFIAGFFFPKQIFGSFAQPRDLCLKIMNAINPVVNRVGMPVIAQYQSQPRRAGEVYMRVLRMSASICFPIYAFVGLAGPKLLPIVLGAKWAEAGGMLPYICLWFAFRSIVNPFGSYMTGMGLSRKALYFQIVFAVIVITAAFVGSQFGANFLSITMSFVYFVFYQIAWLFVLRNVSEIGFWEYNEKMLIPGFCATLSIAFLEFCLSFSPDGSMVAFISYAFSLILLIILNIIFNRAGVVEVVRLSGIEGFQSVFDRFPSFPRGRYTKAH